MNSSILLRKLTTSLITLLTTLLLASCDTAVNTPVVMETMIANIKKPSFLENLGFLNSQNA